MRDIEELLQTVPEGHLHHYTSVHAAFQIIESGRVWASSAYYLNDSSEVLGAVKEVSLEAERTRDRSVGKQKEMLDQLLSWLETLRSPQGLYIFSLSERRNDLSQWRSYTPFGKGVCLSFSQSDVERISKVNGLRTIRCVYKNKEKQSLAQSIVSKTIESWKSSAEEFEQRGPTWLYPLFERLKSNFLTVLASLKNVSFEKETEWRLLTPYVASLSHERVHYRVGASMIVPCYSIDISSNDHLFDYVTIGPTEHNNLSMHAMSAYMSKFKFSRNGCFASGIPYREWK